MKPIGPIPKKVKCISQRSQDFSISDFKVGGEYTVSGDGYIRFESDAESGVMWNSQSGNSKFQPIYTDEELLEYAKKMYPEGTGFYNIQGEYRKSNGTNYLMSHNGCIDVQAFSIEGYIVAPDIYTPSTGWVEIIEPSEESVKQTYMFKEGDPVISNAHPGVTGFTVCGFEDKNRMYLICSPTWNLGHNGAGVIPTWGKVPDTSNNSCWWVHEDSIVLDNQLKENVIDISNINVGDYVKIIDRRVRSHNPNIYISGCDTAVKGGDATVIGTVDIGPSKPIVSRLGDSIIVTKEMVTSEIKKVYGEGGIYDEFVNHLTHLGKEKNDLLPVPSLRVSRKNIVK